MCHFQNQASLKLVFKASVMCRSSDPPGSTPFSHLQMPDDAEALGPVEAAGGGGEQPVGPADQQVTCGRVAAALGAHARLLRQLRADAAAQGCGEEHRRVPATQ